MLLPKKTTVSWQRVADVPVMYATCVAFNDRLLAVGGGTSNFYSTNNIYALNLTTNSWDVTSHMPTARSHCLVAVLPGNKLMVAGGRRDGRHLDTVEIAEMISDLCIDEQPQPQALATLRCKTE